MSSPSSAGDTILDTTVTWRDIEERLEKDLGRKLIFGPKRAVQLIGEGNGFMSRVTIMNTDLQGEASDLPPRIVVKILSKIAGQEVGDSFKNHTEDERLFEGYEENIRKLHNREVNCYRVYSRFDLSVMKIPRMYFAQDYNERNTQKAFLGMECVEGVELRHIFHNVDVKELSDALRGLAYLQAVSLQLTEDEKQKVASNPIANVYGPLLPPQAVTKMLLDVGSRSKMWENCCTELSKMSAEIADMKLPYSLNDELGMKDVMIHGDLWSANLLWKKTQKGFELARIIDFQLAHFGCAAEDLTRLLITTLSGHDRRKNWENLLKEFYGYLTTYCKKTELPYSLEQLKEAYRRFFPFAGTILLPIIDSVAKIGARKIADNEQVAIQETLGEKTQALFEDLLYFAKRNRDVRKIH